MIFAAIASLAACNSAPSNPVDRAESLRVVALAFRPCDSAVAALGSDAQSARNIQAQCAGAGSDLAQADLPRAVYGPCVAASAAARDLGRLAEAAANGLEAGDDAALARARGKVAKSRLACQRALESANP